jgi:hypothetical protein
MMEIDHVLVLMVIMIMEDQLASDVTILVFYAAQEDLMDVQLVLMS